MTSACTYVIAYVCTFAALLVAAPLFGAGYAPELYKEKNYVTGLCRVKSITVVRAPLACSRGTCWSGTIGLTWNHRVANITLEVNETQIVRAITPSSATTILSRRYGIAGTKFTCLYDINKSDQSVLDTLDVSDVISTAPADPLRFLIPAIVFTFFFLLGVVLTLSLLCKPKAPAAASAAAAVAPPPSPAIAAPIAPVNIQPAPVVAQPAAVIDIAKLDLDASVSMNADDVCNICFAHHINAVLKPCNHCFTCTTCGAYFVGKPCGLCRRMVTSLDYVELGAGELRNQDSDSAASDCESTEMSNF